MAAHKPPLGIEPKKNWLIERAHKLIETLNRYYDDRDATGPQIRPEYLDSMSKWAAELGDVLSRICDEHYSNQPGDKH